jgi:hypothetical protein
MSAEKRPRRSHAGAKLDAITAELTKTPEEEEAEVAAESAALIAGRKRPRVFKPKPQEEYVEFTSPEGIKYSVPLHLPDNPSLNTSGYDWYCRVCKCWIREGEEDIMCSNDGCDQCFHRACVGLKELPTGDWFCPESIGCRINSLHNAQQDKQLLRQAQPKPQQQQPQEQLHTTQHLQQQQSTPPQTAPQQQQQQQQQRQSSFPLHSQLPVHLTQQQQPQFQQFHQQQLTRPSLPQNVSSQNPTQNQHNFMGQSFLMNPLRLNQMNSLNSMGSLASMDSLGMNTNTRNSLNGMSGVNMNSFGNLASLGQSQQQTNGSE